MNGIKKLIVPANTESEGLFPLARSTPKELLPLGEVPVIQRVVDEAVGSGVKEVLFVSSSQKKEVVNYFNNFNDVPSDQSSFSERYSSVSFSGFSQKSCSGAYAIYRMKDKIEEDAFIVSNPDSIFHGKKSSLEQIFAIHRTSGKQVIALKEVSENEPGLVAVEAEKIANRFYKIKKVIEDPEKESFPVMALAGRYIFTPSIFDYIGTKTSIPEALNMMITAGKTIYGNVCEGDWFSVVDKKSYLEAQKFFLNNKL